MRKYSFSQRPITEWNKLYSYVNAISASMFKHDIVKYVIRAGYTKIDNCWTSQ